MNEAFVKLYKKLDQFDEFRQEIAVMRRLPWDEGAENLPRTWSDSDDVRCAEWLQRRHGQPHTSRASSSLVRTVSLSNRPQPVTL